MLSGGKPQTAKVRTDYEEEAARLDAVSYLSFPAVA